MNIIFATYAVEREDLLYNYLLANSIRDFAGNMSEISLKIYYSSDLSVQDSMDKFSGLNVRFSEFPATRVDTAYPFKSAAAAACEADVKEGNVIWLDRHMIVLNPCANLLLNPLEQFAYRPPHLKLLAASVDEPINQMWKTAFNIAGIIETDLFPVYTEVDKECIWSYFSAGHYSFRAESGLMGKWNTLFNQLLEHREMKPFLDNAITEDAEYIRIYLHQIALSLTVLKNLKITELKPLPVYYGYPLHLHDDIEQYYRVSQMEQCHTAFYSWEYCTPSELISEKLAFWIQNKAKIFQGRREI